MFRRRNPDDMARADRTGVCGDGHGAAAVRGLGEIGEIWDRFRREDREAAKRWIFTLMLGGQRLPEAWEAAIRALEIA